MPKVPLTATRDFTYMTRRLKAKDDFYARNPLEARILKEVRKVAADPTGKNRIIGGNDLYISDKNLPVIEDDEPAPKAAPKPAAKAPAKPKAGTKARAKKAAAKK